MLIINNESILSNRTIKSEVSCAFKKMPTQVSKFLNHSTLEIIYTSQSESVILDVDFYRDEVTLKDSLGLFDYADNHMNYYRIYICVDNHNQPKHNRLDTLLHELGHYVDYMIGYTLTFAPLTGYHHYSASSHNKFFPNYSDQILEVLRQLSIGYYEVWDWKKTEQFAEYFALFCLDKVNNYAITVEFSTYLTGALDAAIYNLEFFENKTQEVSLSFGQKFLNGIEKFSRYAQSKYKKVFTYEV